MTALVQYKYGSTYGGAGAGINFPFDTAVTNGNAICITLTMGTAAVISSVKDSNGVDLTLDKPAETNQQTNQNVYFYSLQNVIGSPTGVNVKLAADITVNCSMEEVSGMASSSIVDVNPTKATGGYNTTPSLTFPTTTDSVYVRAHFSYGGARTIVLNGGYTANDPSSISRHAAFNVNVGTAGSKTVSGTISSAENWAVSAIGYKTGATGATVSTITGTTVTEAGNEVFTVTMSGTGGLTGAYSWSGTAGAADYTQTLTDGMFTTTGGSGSVTVSGGNIVVPSAVTAFTVTVPTTTDALDEADETVRLVFGGVTSSSGTINDDDAAPTLTGTTSQTVTAGSPVVITYSPGLSGQTRTYTLALTDGTATGGTDYDNTTVTGDFAVTAGTGSVSISGSTVTVDPGVTEFTLSIGTTA